MSWRFKPGQRVHFTPKAIEYRVATRVKSRGYHGTVVRTYALVPSLIVVRRDGYSEVRMYHTDFWKGCRIANCRRTHRATEKAIH